MSFPSPAAVAEQWWSAIDRGDFAAAEALLHPEAVVEWPLSNERMPSAEAWRAVNEHYPGTWRARVAAVVEQGEVAVTRTNVFDGAMNALAISWFTVRDGLITYLVEYWPEVYAAPGWRRQWVEPIRAEAD
jgi:ketosteroid isomerase-like protein